MSIDIGVLISGRGSNLGAILDAVDSGQLQARVAIVISNVRSAQGLERARRAGAPTLVIEHEAYADRSSFETALVDGLLGAGVEWVVLAGFMRILTRTFLDAFPQRVVNIHPSLLPAFPGVDAQAQAIAYGVRLSGCTVHLVDQGVDAGPILAQRAVDVHPDDTRDTLANRILTQEHDVLVSTLEAIADGRLVLERGAQGSRDRAWLRADAGAKDAL